MGGRSRWAIALAVAAMWVLAAAAPAVAENGASVTAVPDGPLAGELVPGPDGRLWHVEFMPGDPPGASLTRLGVDGTSVTTLGDWSRGRA